MDNLKVLVVDDSRVSRMMISSFISGNFESAQITEFGSGDETVEKLQESDFTHAIIDFNMPGMDGLALAAELQPRLNNTHFWLLTANIQESTRQRAESLGIHFMGKPITEEKIVSIIKQQD